MAHGLTDDVCTCPACCPEKWTLNAQRARERGALIEVVTPETNVLNEPTDITTVQTQQVLKD